MLVGEHVEGPARGLPARPGFVQVHTGAAGKATVMAGGCKEGGQSWHPWDHMCVPSDGGAQSCLWGCISAGEDPTLSPGFSSPARAAFRLHLPLSAPLGWER